MTDRHHPGEPNALNERAVQIAADACAGRWSYVHDGEWEDVAREAVTAYLAAMEADASGGEHD